MSVSAQNGKDGLPELPKNSKDQYSRVGVSERSKRQNLVLANSATKSIAVVDFAGGGKGEKKLKKRGETEFGTQLTEILLELLSVVEGRSVHRPHLASDLPFALHCHYSRDEIVTPFRDNPESMRQGTFYAEKLGLDVHLITLRKSERDFSPTTRYADYFISPDQLHWESQSTTTLQSPTGQRLIRGLGRHLFFVRENKVEDGRTAPLMCLGFARPVSFEGERPIRLVWKLDHVVPDHVYMAFRAAAG